MELAAKAGFTVKSICRCRIVFGPIPLDDFGMLTHGFSKKALMATDIADRIGATFVIGEPRDLDELRKLELPASEKRCSEASVADKVGLPAVAQWLRNGERGSSSNAMCERMFGVYADGRGAHPHDPDDLRRCLLFLDATQAHDKVGLMADVSPQWSKLVVRWSELIACLKQEAGAGDSAPKTYSLMQEVLK